MKFCQSQGWSHSPRVRWLHKNMATGKCGPSGPPEWHTSVSLPHQCKQSVIFSPHFYSTALRFFVVEGGGRVDRILVSCFSLESKPYNAYKQEARYVWFSKGFGPHTLVPELACEQIPSMGANLCLPKEQTGVSKAYDWITTTITTMTLHITQHLLWV